jgi:hypothetical protein
MRVEAAEEHFEEEERSLVGELEVVDEDHPRLAFEKTGRELDQRDEDSLAPPPLVFLDGCRAGLEIGEDVAEVVELSRVESVEGGDTLVGALPHERQDRLTREIVGPETLLTLARELHDREGLIGGKAPSYRFDES